MSFKVLLYPTKVEFAASPLASLLDSALEAKLHLPHSCKNGDCGSCMAVLKSGTVMLENGDCISSGEFLTCNSLPRSHLEVFSEYYPELSDIKIKNVPVKVADVVQLGDVLQIKFRLPPTQKFEFLSGQYVNLSYKGITRPYSIANVCGGDEGIELHIKKMPNGKMSDLLFDGVANDTLMRINGPHGTFFIREDMAPIIFLVTGTGFAPAKAMIETLIHQNTSRKVYLFWGARYQSDIYSSLPGVWSKQFDNFTYMPVLSRPPADWNMGIGHVQYVAARTLDSIVGCHVYACGSGQMIDDAKSLFLSLGLKEEYFYSDAFTAAKN